jgi:hypothetical protein
MPRSRIYDVDEFLNEMLALSVTLVAESGNRTIQGELLTGFLGLSQEARTFRVKPEIGWVVRERRTPLSAALHCAPE